MLDSAMPQESLVVEDEPDIRKLIVLHLTVKGVGHRLDVD